MNFNQLTAAAAAAAAGNPTSINMNSFTTAVSNILANSNIDLSQLASLSQLGQSAALGAAANIQPPPPAIPSARHNLPQAHHHRQPTNSSLASLNATEAAQAALAGLPASLSNLTSSALADLAANAAAAAAHQSSQQPNVRSSSLQSAHHRSSLSIANQQQHHLNHHSSPSATITAAHQSTSVAKSLAAHQSHNISIPHHRHSSSHNAHHNTSFNNLKNNNINKTNLSSSLNNSFNTSFNNLNSSIVSNNSNNISNNNISSKNAALSSAMPAIVATSNQSIVATNSTSSITPPKNSTCYRIGDCIYFDTAPTLPLQIGKLDEICKLSGDNIEVKVVLFFRRTDIPNSLMSLADKYQYDEIQEVEIKKMSDKEKNLLRQRELYYSRQIETIPATAIRGKCTVQLLNESETLASYLDKEDHYFYTLIFDPNSKSITADKGEIRVGSRYQAEVQPNSIFKPQASGDPADPRDLNEMETLVYTPDHCLTDDEINKFLTIAKSVGTFARALDCSSSIKQPSLHLTAASASRDVTLLYAMQLLHQNDYDLGKAVCALVPSTGPVLCRDEIEEWTAGEATLFEEAIEKYGREFNEIRQDFLPWKSVKNIVEYYYMWKTTDRSINQRRMKALEAENKATILYISDQDKKSLNNVVGASMIEHNNSKASISRTSSNSGGSGVGNSTTSSNNVSVAGGSVASIVAASAGPTSVTKEEVSMESTNATLKRRQVTEQLPKHSTPGENLRWIATSKFKKSRIENYTREQYKHMSRRPWERRPRPAAAK